jgi:hypothetical protein
MHRRFGLLGLTALLALAIVLHQSHWHVAAAGKSHPEGSTRRLVIGQRVVEGHAPAPAIEPYVRPEFASQMRALRPTILEAARRHNRPELSHMNDREFAVVIAIVLYNENFGSLEDRVPPLRPLTPLYQDFQIGANKIGGGNLSVWPANLRPSVALEILRQQVPVPEPTGLITEPIEVAGSHVNIANYRSESELYTVLTQEIADPYLAVEYLAANLERGLYRARFEGVSVSWHTLAAWHNQGIVAPKDIRDNDTARDYIRRASAYIATAYALIDTP